MSNVGTMLGPFLQCDVCRGAIEEVEFYDCIRCANRLHKLCVYDSEHLSSTDNILTCICPECKQKKPRGDNSDTPVRTNANLNVTYRRDRAPELNRSMEYGAAFDLSIILTEIRQLKAAVGDLALQNDEIALLRREVAELKHQISLLSSTSQPTSEKDKTMEFKDSEITDLRTTIAELQQQGLRNELEIAGIPETQNENIFQLVLVAATKIGVELAAADIDGVHRAGPRRSALVPSPSNPKNLPRPIVVKLARRAKRDEMIKAAKERKNVTSQDIVAGTNSDIFMNERLTKANRLLFRSTRLRALQYKFRFSWVRDGCIFVRKAEKSPAIPIRTEQDIDQKIGPYTNSSTSHHKNI